MTMRHLPSRPLRKVLQDDHADRFSHHDGMDSQRILPLRIVVVARVRGKEECQIRDDPEAVGDPFLPSCHRDLRLHDDAPVLSSGPHHAGRVLHRPDRVVGMFRHRQGLEVFDLGMAL